MRFTYSTTLAAFAALAVGISDTEAQGAADTRVDSFRAGQLTVLDKPCPHGPADSLAKPGDKVAVAGSTGFAPIVAGFLGDVASAALTTAATALEEASRAKGYGVEGVTAFEFYEIPQAGRKVSVRPFGPQRCLLLSTTPLAAGNTSAPTDEVFVEVAVRVLADGFTVRPVYVHYAKALPGAPAKAAKTELHVEFSIPAANEKGAVAAATAFGLARISLPPIAPGETLELTKLGMESELLAFRPETGMLTAVRQRLQPLDQAAVKQADFKVVEAQRKLFLGARILTNGDITYPDDPKCPDCEDDKLEALAIAKLSEEKKAQLKAIDERLLAARIAYGEADARARTIPIADLPGSTGTSTIKARFLVIKDANRFGLAIAEALKKQAPALSAAVTAKIDPADKPSWTAQNSAYFNAQARVERAQGALAAARLGTDKPALQLAETEYLAARLDMNVAAAALKLPAPYPAPRLSN
jgi:hypothetical protein